jgi:hypothetical protein
MAFSGPIVKLLGVGHGPAIPPRWAFLSTFQKKRVKYPINRYGGNARYLDLLNYLEMSFYLTN